MSWGDYAREVVARAVAKAVTTGGRAVSERYAPGAWDSASAVVKIAGGKSLDQELDGAIHGWIAADPEAPLMVALAYKRGEPVAPPQYIMAPVIASLARHLKIAEALIHIDLGPQDPSTVSRREHAHAMMREAGIDPASAAGHQMAERI